MSAAAIRRASFTGILLIICCGEALGWRLEDSGPRYQAALSLLGSESSSPLEKRGAASTILELASAGRADAKAIAALLLMRGELVERDVGMAVSHLRSAATSGVAQAQYELGALHRLGQLVPLDSWEAYRLTKAAAEGGHAGAMNDLSVMYDNGEALYQSSERSRIWLERAVSAGLPLAKFNLGARLLSGDGYSRDEERGLSLIRQAADEGQSEAATVIGRELLSGERLGQDVARGVAYLSAAAIAQDQNAVATLKAMTTSLPLVAPNLGFAELLSDPTPAARQIAVLSAADQIWAVTEVSPMSPFILVISDQWSFGYMRQADLSVRHHAD